MTRIEADALVCSLEEWIDACQDEHRFLPGTPQHERAALVANTCRERLIDALCGEEATEPMAGRGL